MYEQASKLRQIMAQKHLSETSLNSVRVYCVTSGKGGVGKTNISVNMAIAIQNLGKKVLLVDADLGLANVDVVTGLFPKYNISHFLNVGKPLEDIIIKGPQGIRILPGASGLNRLADITSTELDRFISGFKDLSIPIDTIIIDTGAGISKNVINFINSSDEVIVITTPEPSAVTDAYAIIKTIHRYPQKIHVIVNRADNYKEADFTMDKIGRASQKFLNTKIEYLGYVLEDKTVYSSNMNQTPFYIKYPNGLATKCITNIGEKLLYGDQTPNPGDKTVKTWFEKLMSFIRNDRGAE